MITFDKSTELLNSAVKANLHTVSGYVKGTETIGNKAKVTYSYFIIYLEPCSDTCDECAAEDPNECTKCVGDLYLFEKECRSCPAGTYYGADNKCEECHVGCKSCISSGNSITVD